MSFSLALSIFVVGAGLALFGQFMVLRDAFAGRTPAASQTLGSRMREALWIMIPAVVLVITLWATWRALPHPHVSPYPGPVAARPAS